MDSATTAAGLSDDSFQAAWKSGANNEIHSHHYFQSVGSEGSTLTTHMPTTVGTGKKATKAKAKAKDKAEKKAAAVKVTRTKVATTDKAKHQHQHQHQHQNKHQHQHQQQLAPPSAASNAPTTGGTTTPSPVKRGAALTYELLAAGKVDAAGNVITNAAWDNTTILELPNGVTGIQGTFDEEAGGYLGLFISFKQLRRIMLPSTVRDYDRNLRSRMPLVSTRLLA
jgi:hypothetical protein